MTYHSVKRMVLLSKNFVCLTRSIFVVDKDDKVTYVEYVPEVTDHPDYEKAIEAVKEVTK